MDYHRYKPPYDRDGYVVIRRFLTREELSELRFHIHRFIREVVPALPETQVFHAVGENGHRQVRLVLRMNCDAFFEGYRSHPKWLSLAQTLLGETADAHPPIYFDKPPTTDVPTPPHQDNCSLGLDPPSGVEMLLATDGRMDEENGCLRYVPGSHRGGLRPHTYSGVRGFALAAEFGPADEAREVAVALDPGDLVCHHPLTVHRALSNRSRHRSRTAFGMWFQGRSARQDPEISEFYNTHARKAQLTGR
ncbi:phytanoyl-CoA dioxygenase family protein [Streptomyces sp. NPDC048506]|uniref:phytanoyl-CoA dioxygenase family protein n=1 Tax=Streptomyces sp. NPDC048506 TaxID=3155028 RepID=UPI0034167BAA